MACGGRHAGGGTQREMACGGLGGAARQAMACGRLGVEHTLIMIVTNVCDVSINLLFLNHVDVDCEWR
ncbi:hypothetical protein E2562_023889 [Oryza meyeriana var. granulata]|uniref:Uncharacterized protein n=1 Tax=Oryza meyeriana var. granulata TaxID=110450 RepID=A0A6G1D7I9_9ORYZ|nr:hypothetical protein E2562_023889 [Oryza meyeriana var. granulata]